jgi:hypothetical protein
MPSTALALDGRLFALAEFTGEIRLVCLDSRTGGLDWKQPLANIEEHDLGIALHHPFPLGRR